MNVSYAQAAKELDVNPGTFKRWVHEGLPVERIGRVVRVDMSKARRWIAGRPKLRTVRPTRVYFGRQGDRIKIGFARDVPRRAQELGIDVITSLPGGKPLELLFHKHFEASRIEGEWYRETPDLLAVIDCIARGHD